VKLRNLPLRLATGAYILNSGLDKRGLPEEAAAGMQGMGAVAIPQLAQLKPQQFATLLSTSEVALGAALLAPFVPPIVAGAALTGFSSALLAMYWKTPSMHKPGNNPFPSPEGIGYAKDVWMLGIGLSLVLGSITDKTTEVAHSVSSAASGAVGSATGAVSGLVSR
jgi:uncharacterized membrane protein YphA (DoxX/SURF4 family)